MDVLAVTDFPISGLIVDTVRREGSILLIPSEGGYCSIYVELDKLNETNGFRAEHHH